MKEHYVSYEQSQALKRLGFKEEVSHYYCHFKSDGEVKLWSTNPPDNHNARLSINEVCSAPRLDQAQEWLREKGIIVYTKPILKSVGDEELQDFKFILKGYRFHVIKLDNAHHQTSYDYPTDEQALSAGISKALELLGKEVSNGM